MQSELGLEDAGLVVARREGLKIPLVKENGGNAFEDWKAPMGVPEIYHLFVCFLMFASPQGRGVHFLPVTRRDILCQN